MFHVTAVPGAHRDAPLCLFCAWSSQGCSPVPGAHRDLPLCPCCARSSQGFALSVLCPLSQFAGMCSAPTTRNPTGQLLPPKERQHKSLLNKQSQWLFLPGFYAEQHKDVFPANEPKLPLSFASSHAHLLPPACTPPPWNQEGRNKQHRVLQTPSERRMCWQFLTMYPLLYPLLTLAAPPQLLILVLDKAARGRMPATLCKAPMETETQVKD